MLNNIKLTILKTLKTISELLIPEGNIKRKQIQTPIAQKRLISSDDFRFSILAIKGIFQKGKIKAAIIPIILSGEILF